MTPQFLLALAAAELIMLLAYIGVARLRLSQCNDCHREKNAARAQLARLLSLLGEYRECLRDHDVLGVQETLKDLAAEEADARRFLFQDAPAQAWLHLKRGTQYYILARDVRLNISGTKLRDGDAMYLYADVVTGRLSVRQGHEFMDGRFVLEEEGGKD